MQVAKYTFQSPSTSPVQVGRLDPSSVQKEAPKEKPSPSKIVAFQGKTVGELLQNNAPQNFKAAPTVSQQGLDLYA